MMMMSLFSRPRASFTTKVLVPVMGMLVALVSFTAWLLQSQVRRQVEADAAKTLFSSRRGFEQYREFRIRELRNSVNTLRHEPRLRASVNLGDPKTLQPIVQNLVDELQVDFILVRDADGARMALGYRDPDLDPASLSVHVHTAGLGAAPAVGTATTADMLFDAVSGPVLLGERLLGTLVLGTAVSQTTAQDLEDHLQCHVAFFLEDRILASSLLRPGTRAGLREVLDQRASEAWWTGSDKDLMLELDGEHYLAGAVPLERRPQAPSAHAVLLTNYEAQLRSLQATQHKLFLFGLFGSAITCGMAWLVIHRTTRPLHNLQAQVEAVGRGEFDQRIPVRTNDEIGDLARSFNEMTESLDISRTKLEQTLESLRDTRSRLLQTEKLSAIGEFIAGVAHELNNPLTIMVGYAQMLQEFDLDPDHQEHLRTISESAERCHKIVQNLLSFARQRPPEWSRVKINLLLEGTLHFLKYELRTSSVTTETDLDPSQPRMMGDPHQLQQVFLNIVNNARQAMVEHQIQGAIRLSTAVRGEEVVIRIADTGPGIPEPHREKIFDPFFTTKEQGKGTGLGLSVSYGIVKEHQGEITVDSREGEGTCFEMRFPLAPPADAPDPDTNPGEEPVDLQAADSEHILVVDDEPDILGLIATTLRKADFAVDTAHDGKEALEALRGRRYDLILCDWKMPGMSGQEFYQRLRELDPALTARFVFMTGDVLNDRMLRFMEDSGATYLAKPFSLKDFRAVLHTVLVG